MNHSKLKPPLPLSGKQKKHKEKEIEISQLFIILQLDTCNYYTRVVTSCNSFQKTTNCLMNYNNQITIPWYLQMGNSPIPPIKNTHLKA